MTRASKHDGPAEPLAESAPLAWEAAPRLCAGDPGGFDCCRWYHQVWQYLRLMSLITSIRANTGFLVETFAGLAADGHYRRVLISGTADYGMLAHLAHAYGRRPLQATALDLCETPLFLNRWYGERFGLDVSTVRRDVLQYAAERPFDLICTHNFLGRFDPASRQTLVARWRSLLRPGGVVVTTQRVEPRLEPETGREASRRAERLRARVMAAAEAGSWPGPAAAALADAAYEGWRRRADVHRIRSVRDVTSLFEAEGFDMVLADDGGGAAERAHDRGTPTYSGDAFRARFIARRRP